MLSLKKEGKRNRLIFLAIKKEQAAMPFFLSAHLFFSPPSPSPLSFSLFFQRRQIGRFVVVVALFRPSSAPAAEEGLGARAHALGRARGRRGADIDRPAPARRSRPQPDRAGAVRAPGLQHVADAPPVSFFNVCRRKENKKEKKKKKSRGDWGGGGKQLLLLFDRWGWQKRPPKPKKKKNSTQK